MASNVASAGLERPKTIEIHEFVRFRPGDDLISIRRYRTTYHGDGRISRETPSTEAALERTILAFRGYVQQSDGALLGLFDAPEAAQECAEAIAVHHGQQAEVSGNQVIVALRA